MVWALVVRALVAVALALGLTGCGPEPGERHADRAPRGASDPRPGATVEVEAGPLTEQGTPASPRFTPAHYDGWLDRIPAHLPLAVGMPGAGGDFQRSHAPVRLAVCGREIFGRRRQAVDTRALTTIGPEFADQHAILLLEDDRAAAHYLESARSYARGCPTETHGSTSWALEVRPTRTGFLAVRTYADGGRVVPGADWWEASRVGNAVLLTSTGGEYLPESVPRGVREHRRQLRPLVSSLCVFTPGGCPVDDPDITTDFPLASGYPADGDAEGPGYGRAGPSRALPLADFELCEHRSSPPGSTDGLGAAWRNVEDFRDRHLLTFPDATAASDWIGQLRAFWAACPREPTGEGFVGLQTLRRTAVGGESWALVRHFRFQGAPGVGLVVIQVVRLGRAVLVDQVSNEGGAGPELEAEISGVLDGMTRASRGVVAAMCAYTEAGCPS